jgi:hypothetical protein
MRTETNHFQVVKDSISGERGVDEQTLASLTILAERLERLKKLDNAFSDIAFSPAVKKLAKRANTVAVC